MPVVSPQMPPLCKASSLHKIRDGVPSPTALLEGFPAGQASVAQDAQTASQTASLGATSSFLSWRAKEDLLVLVSLLYLKWGGIRTLSLILPPFQCKVTRVPERDTVAYTEM